MNYNLTRVNIANASAGIGFKEAPRDVEVVVTGFGIVDRADKETGEIKKFPSLRPKTALYTAVILL